MSTPRTETTGAGVTARLPRGLRVARRRNENPVAAPRFREATGSGRHQRMPGPAVVVYRIADGRHQQTGIVVEVSLEDYRAGRIRQHEATQPDRERLLVESTEASRLQRTPVTLTHSPHPALREVTASLTSTEPDVDLIAGDGTRHTAWFRQDPGLSRAAELGLRGVDSLYIADGHHRMAAAERYATRRHHLGPDHPAAFTLAALFPADEMRVFGYHRCLPASRESAAGMLEKLRSLPVSESCEAHPAATPEPGVVVVRFADERHRLKLRPRDADVRASLDIVTLDEMVLPELGIAPTSCGAGPPENCRHPAGEALLFVAHPPTIEQIMAVSDESLLMPPKATWFSPKPAPGLFLRDLAVPR